MGCLKLEHRNFSTSLKVVHNDLKVSANSRAGAYRYGFNGMEKDDEIGGNGSYMSFGDYGYDTRIGRRWNIDPKSSSIHAFSPYTYALNNPLVFIDPNGEIPFPLLEKWVNSSGKTVTRRVDSKYGMRTHRGKTRMHRGIDMNMGGGDDDLGAPVRATHSGKIIKMESSDKDGGGTRIYIQSADGTIQTRYMHLDKFADGLKVGQEVKEGQTIGYVGNTAFGKKKGTATHLHYEMLQKDENGAMVHINPMDQNGNMKDPQKMLGLTAESNNKESGSADTELSELSGLSKEELEYKLGRVELKITMNEAAQSIINFQIKMNARKLAKGKITQDQYKARDKQLNDRLKNKKEKLESLNKESGVIKSKLKSNEKT